MVCLVFRELFNKEATRKNRRYVVSVQDHCILQTCFGWLTIHIKVISRQYLRSVMVVSHIARNVWEAFLKRFTWVTGNKRIGFKNVSKTFLKRWNVPLKYPSKRFRNVSKRFRTVSETFHERFYNLQIKKF